MIMRKYLKKSPLIDYILANPNDIDKAIMISPSMAAFLDGYHARDSKVEIFYEIEPLSSGLLDFKFTYKMNEFKDDKGIVTIQKFQFNYIAGKQVVTGMIAFDDWQGFLSYISHYKIPELALRCPELYLPEKEVNPLEMSERECVFLYNNCNMNMLRLNSEHPNEKPAHSYHEFMERIIVLIKEYYIKLNSEIKINSDTFEIFRGAGYEMVGLDQMDLLVELFLQDTSGNYGLIYFKKGIKCVGIKNKYADVTDYEILPAGNMHEWYTKLKN